MFFHQCLDLRLAVHRLAFAGEVGDGVVHVLDRLHLLRFLCGRLRRPALLPHPLAVHPRKADDGAKAWVALDGVLDEGVARAELGVLAVGVVASLELHVHRDAAEDRAQAAFVLTRYFVCFNAHNKILKRIIKQGNSHLLS